MTGWGTEGPAGWRGRPTGAEAPTVDRGKPERFKPDAQEADPFKADPREGNNRLPRAAREAIRDYVRNRDADGRISADEFTSNTEIGRELQALGVKEPGHAAQYARRYAAYPDGEHHEYRGKDEHHGRDRNRAETQREAVRQEFDNPRGRHEQWGDDDRSPFRFEPLYVRNPATGEQTGGDINGFGRVVNGGFQVINGEVINGAGQVVVGASEIVGQVLNSAGQLVGVQVAGGQVVMLNGQVLSTPPGVAAGQTLLYQGNGTLTPTNNPTVVNPIAGVPTGSGPDGQPVTGVTPPAQALMGSNGAVPTELLVPLAPPPSSQAPAGSTPGGNSIMGTDPAIAAAVATQMTATAAAATGSQANSSTVAEAKAAVQNAFRDPNTPIPGQPEQGKPGPAAPTGSSIPGGDLGDIPRDVVRTVQNILSELTGYSLSLGQTRQFMSQLTPVELTAFLANPMQKLPDVMSTLMNIVMRDHGRPDRVGRDALLAMFDHLMSRRASPQQIYNFFKSLTRDQVEQLITYRAEMIGNLPGVPQEVRAAANLQRIEAELTVMQNSSDPAAQRRAQTLEQLLAQNAQILHFDNAPDGRLAAGRISQVFGNLAEAKHVGLLIPGLNNTMDNFSARAQRGQLLQQLAQPMARDGVAMVVWLERLGQEVLKQYKSMLTAWQAREQQTRAPMTFQQALAQAARQLAQETVPGMMLRGDARLTFVGHSFGSLIAKESLNQGAKPDACVFLGMPEHRLKKIGAQAGCGDVDLYSMVADGDTVDEALAADEAPEAAGATGLDEEFERLDLGEDLVPPIEACLDPHDNYGLEGSASLAQIVGVTLGWRPKLLPPEPRIVTLYRSADGTFEDQTEPVGWFGRRGEEW